MPPRRRRGTAPFVDRDGAVSRPAWRPATASPRRRHGSRACGPASSPCGDTSCGSSDPAAVLFRSPDLTVRGPSQPPAPGRIAPRRGRCRLPSPWRGRPPAPLVTVSSMSTPHVLRRMLARLPDPHRARNRLLRRFYVCLSLLTGGPGATGRSYSDFRRSSSRFATACFPATRWCTPATASPRPSVPRRRTSTSGSPAGTDDRARHSRGPAGGRRRKCHPAGNVNQSSTNTKPVATAISTAQVVS